MNREPLNREWRATRHKPAVRKVLFEEGLIKQSVLRMTGYTPGEQQAGRRIVKLNTNENPYPPSPRVGRVLASCAPASLRLYPDPVCLRLRRIIARRHRCAVDRILVGNGSDEILSLCTRAFVEDDGSIGFFEPSYSLYPVLAQIRDVPARPVELGPEFAWRMPPRYRASLFFLANPNAPTSLLFPKAAVTAFCRSFPGVVLIDEAYADFARENCVDLALRFPNVLVMRTLSKSFSLAGIRLGYLVGARRLIRALYTIKDSYNVDRLSQDMAAAALTDELHMRRNTARIKRTRARLSRRLEQRGFRVTPSETNFLWVKPAGISARSLQAGLRARGILIRHFPGRRTGDFVRISIGTEAEINRLLKAMDHLL